MTEYVQASITILSLVNPFICGAMFAGAQSGDSGTLASATKAAIMIFSILLVAALVGARLLDLFGISLSAFKVAGGIVLSWMGFSMLRGAHAHADARAPEAATESLSRVILFAASPGTITGVITIAIHHSGHALPATALVGITVSIAVTWVVMLLAGRTGAGARGGLLRDVTTRFMGLIVLAMGVQFALSGWVGFTASG